MLCRPTSQTQLNHPCRPTDVDPGTAAHAGSGADSFSMNATAELPLTRQQVERDWHDRHFAAAQHEPRNRWFGSRLRAWFYSEQTARHADRYLMALAARDLRGQTALDYGCGLEKQIWRELAERGATTYAFDISYEAVHQVEHLARQHGVAVQLATAAAEQLPFADESFHLIVGESILHHLELGTALAELRRIVRPNGVCIFREPLQGNILVRLFRRLTPNDRTPTERPFTDEDMALIRSYFEIAHERQFFLLAPLSIVLAPFSRRLATLAWHGLMQLDRALLQRFPGLATAHWQTVLVLRRPSAD